MIENSSQTVSALSFLFTKDGFYLDPSVSFLPGSWAERFLRDAYHALYQFGLEELPTGLSPSAVFLHRLSDIFFKLLTVCPELELARDQVKVLPTDAVLEELLRAVGAEFIDGKWIGKQLKKLNEIFAHDIAGYDGTVELYLTEKSQRLRVPERVFFHLVENREDENWPFAFLATYATRTAKGKIRHVPLQYALTEYKNERQKLLALLACLNKAAEVSPLIAGFMESGEMFHPLRMTSQEAYTFLKDIPQIEETGILCRIPNWWRKRASSVSLSVSLGEERPAMLGFDALVSMKPGLMVDGVPLSEEEIRSLLEQELSGDISFLTVTTYGMAARLKGLTERNWQCLILDEAQAIKNPGTNQTRAIKKIPARMRIAMTGTPIENDLTNLWSLFDFLNKGLLGTAKEFHEFSKNLSEYPEGYEKLKLMVSPFILRRLKTDRRVIADLPDKLETVDYVSLSKKQVVLYRKQIAELEEKLAEAEGMERRGLVLAVITRLKQICNHPDQYLGQKEYAPEDSGKFEMLRELCETIYEKRERVLIFTQFKEIAEDLAAFLEGIFHSKGYVLHGGTPVKVRSQMVDDFNGEKYVPFMVLSVKAGGTGLNLTAANHVIHFDRWWNPAVENQATDRAYRIGQKKNVMVHKLVCEKTVEERIDDVINSKKALADSVIGAGGEKWITELNNEELLKILRLG